MRTPVTELAWPADGRALGAAGLGGAICTPGLALVSEPAVGTAAAETQSGWQLVT